MTCDEYRLAIAAEPGSPSDLLASHATTCTECAAFGRDMEALDAVILRALQIKAPDLHLPELPALDDASNVVPLASRRMSTPIWLGLAASIVIVAVIAIRQLVPVAQYPSLEAEILAHLDHEPHAMTVTAEAEAGWRVDNVIGPYAEMDRTAGLITYARTCVIDGHSVPHLVLQGENGPVTLILLPDEKIDAARPIEGESVSGVILPVGNGSIAIISERDQPLDAIEQKVILSMQWKT
jgi:hypothetical protein